MQILFINNCYIEEDQQNFTAQKMKFSFKVLFKKGVNVTKSVGF